MRTSCALCLVAVFFLGLCGVLTWLSGWEPAVNALARIGLVRIDFGGRVTWPVRAVPLRTWRIYLLGGPFRADGWGWFCVFRNDERVVRDIPGRLLPRRWGFRFLGLEVGDRGGHGRLILLRGGRPFEPAVRVSTGARRCWARYRGGWWCASLDPAFPPGETARGLRIGDALAGLEVQILRRGIREERAHG